MGLNFEEQLLARLKDPKEASSFLQAALDEGDAEGMLIGLSTIAKAKGGLTLLAKKTGIHRVHLYRMLGKDGNPSFKNTIAVLDALGVQVGFSARKRSPKKSAGAARKIFLKQPKMRSSLIFPLIALCLLFCRAPACANAITDGMVGKAPTGLGKGTPALLIQAYPAGLQGTLEWTQPLLDVDEGEIYAGYNATHRWDWGLHNDERGGGPGLGLGWRHFFGAQRVGWAGGLRLDLWQMAIDWSDGEIRGRSNVSVLQPALELLWRKRWSFWNPSPELSLSLGQEINVRTDGQAVGQGLIFRLGLGWQFPPRMRW